MPLELRSNGWITVPWAEAMGAHLQHRPQGSFGYDQSGTMLTYSIYVNGGDLVQALTDILGTHIFNAEDGNLRRTLPVKHPVCSWLYAKRIVHLEPLKWTLKEMGGQEGYGIAGTPASAWKWWLLTIGFEVPRYRMIPDSEMVVTYSDGNGNFQEWQRYCTWNVVPGIHTLSREGGSFKWADNGGKISPKIGDSFAAPIGQYIAEDRLICTWHNVPMRGLMNTFGKMNSNIEGCRNKLNNVTFLDYPGCPQSGVLRFDGWETREVPLPLPFDKVGITDFDFPLLFDVVLSFTVLDPPYGNAAYRGHNLGPNPGDSEGAWFLISTDGTTTGASVYPTTDLSAIWRLSAS